MSDITLVIEEKPFRLYKGFLASNSPVFAKMLFGEFAEKSKDVIELKEVSAEAFTDMLDFLRPILQLTGFLASLLAVLSLADRFDMAAVFPKVEHSLLIAPETVRLNAGKMLCIADKYKMATLLSHCLSRWENSKASTLANEMHADLSSGTSYAIFLNLSAQPSAK